MLGILLGDCQLLRPWPNDQTMLVQHWRFACQAKCLIVWPHVKTLLAQQRLRLRQAKDAFERFQNYNAPRKILLLSFVKQCFRTWPNGQTFIVQQIWSLGRTLFDRLVRPKRLHYNGENVMWIVNAVFKASCDLCIPCQSLHFIKDDLGKSSALLHVINCKLELWTALKARLEDPRERIQGDPFPTRSRYCMLFVCTGTRGSFPFWERDLMFFGYARQVDLFGLSIHLCVNATIFRVRIRFWISRANGFLSTRPTTNSPHCQLALLLDQLAPLSKSTRLTFKVNSPPLNYKCLKLGLQTPLYHTDSII